VSAEAFCRAYPPLSRVEMDRLGRGVVAWDVESETHGPVADLAGVEMVSYLALAEAFPCCFQTKVQATHVSAVAISSVKAAACTPT
jgi:hypothetical protein